MAIIRLCTGTTEDYEAVEDILVLTEREIAVEIVTDENGNTYHNIRQGDGVSTFFDLPIIVNNQRYEELYTVIEGYYETIMEFSSSMTAAIDAANSAAAAAETATTAANAAVEQVADLTAGLLAVVDDVTSVEYVIGVENGILYIDDGEED